MSEATDMLWQKQRELDALRAENARLRAALKALVSDIEDYERVNNLAANPGMQVCWQSVAEARATLEHTKERQHEPDPAAT
jgi:hypothetical protein